jgi:hypothetical protein
VSSAVCTYIATPFDGRENANRGVFDTFTEDIHVGNSDTNRIENAVPFCNGNGRKAFDPGTATAEDTRITQNMLQLDSDPVIVMNGV